MSEHDETEEVGRFRVLWSENLVFPLVDCRCQQPEGWEGPWLEVTLTGKLFEKGVRASLREWSGVVRGEVSAGGTSLCCRIRSRFFYFFFFLIDPSS